MPWTLLIPGLPATPSSIDIAVSNTASGNVLYVAYTEKVRSTTSRAVVKRWDAGLNQWEPVGGTQVGTFSNSPDIANSYAAIAVNSNGTPYVFYGNRLGQLLVKKLAGGNWTSLPDVPANDAQSPSICFNTNVPDHPYVAYTDNQSGHAIVRVKKYDGSTWQSIDPTTSNGRDISIAIANGFPYIVNNDVPSQQAIVQHWNGLGWGAIGALASVGIANLLHIAINNSKPYIVFQDSAMGQKATVMHYTGISGWKEVRDNGTLADFPHTTPNVRVGNTAIAIDNANNVIIAFTDLSNGILVKVIEFNGSQWVNVGDPIATNDAGIVAAFRLIVDDNNLKYFAHLQTQSLGPGVWQFS